MYKCKPCGETFYSTYDCQAHLNTAHEEATEEGCVHVQYRCEVCGWLFEHPTDVRNHALREHGMQKPRYVEVETAIETA